jgi:hypothetical protein
MSMFFWLLVGHAVADFPLQGKFLAAAKCGAVPSIPRFWALFWHSLIHGGAVAVVTHSVVLGILETLIHMIIDHLKCVGRTTFTADQWIHVGCKAAYAFVLWSGPL